MSRATDDSGNIETPSSGVSVNVSCPCSLWGAGTPGGVADSGDSTARLGRNEVPVRRLRRLSRRPLLQGGGRHGDARRQPVDHRRVAAGVGHLHERDRVRLAAGQLLQACHDLPEHHLRGLLLRAERPLRDIIVVVLLPGTGPWPAGRRPLQQSSAPRDSQSRQRERRLHIRGQRLPDQHLSVGELLGGRRHVASAATRPGDGRQRSARQRRGIRDLERANDGRRAHLLCGHAVHRNGRAAIDHRERLAGSDQRHHHRTHEQRHLHVHGHRGGSERRRAAFRSVESDHAVVRRIPSRRSCSRSPPTASGQASP